MADTEDRLASIERRLDRLEQGVGAAPVPADVRDALAQGDTILAIKRLREATGIGLKEAKDRVDALQPERAARRKTMEQLVFWVGLTLLGVLIWVLSKSAEQMTR